MFCYSAEVRQQVFKVCVGYKIGENFIHYVIQHDLLLLSSKLQTFKTSNLITTATGGILVIPETINHPKPTEDMSEQEKKSPL